MLVTSAAVLRWFTTRYRITPSRIELRHGLLRRKSITAPLDRVRTVDVSSHALHRLLGLARVVIGTGTSDRKGRPQLVLDGLARAEATGLRQELLHRVPIAGGADQIGGPMTIEETELARFEPRWIGFGPFTLSGAVTALAIAGFGWRVISESQTDPARFGPLHSLIEHLRHAPLWQVSLQVAFAVIVFVAALSTAGYVLAFWNFRLVRHAGGSLFSSRGLVTTRTTSIEERRLRGVEVSEPLLLRAVGGARTIAIATGLRVGRGSERGGTLLLPPAPKALALTVAGTVLATDEPFRAPLRAHGRAATRRRYVRGAGAGLLIAGASTALGALGGGLTAGLIIGALLLGASLALAADRAASLGHALVGGYLVTRFGSLVRRRCTLRRDGIIGWNVRRSFYQRRAGLATLTATTAAGRQGYRVVDLPLDEVVALLDAATPGLLADLRGRRDSELSRSR